MKTIVYNYPKSSFLSVEKDMGIIVDMVIKNDHLCKMLHYTTKDSLSQPALTQKEKIGLFERNIKIVPKLYIDNSVLNYIIINFDNFTPNVTNPEFRDNILSFDIICHFDQWQLKDFQLRPYRIAAELDAMFDHQRLTGIGEVEFIGANRLTLSEEYGGLCLMYQVIHGEEDKKKMPNPMDEESFLQNFNAMFNDQ